MCKQILGIVVVKYMGGMEQCKCLPNLKYMTVVPPQVKYDGCQGYHLSKFKNDGCM